MSNKIIVSELVQQVLGAAIEVHRELGPGLLESAYEHCLAHELTLRNIPYRRQVLLPLLYKGTTIDCGYRIDLLVAEELILELKCVAQITALHEAQMLTYLRLAKLHHGFLINFNVKLLRNGIRSFVL